MLARRAFMSRSELAGHAPEEGSRRWLIAELDKYTSIIARSRDRHCITCGAAQGLQCSTSSRAGTWRSGSTSSTAMRCVRDATAATTATGGPTRATC